MVMIGYGIDRGGLKDATDMYFLTFKSSYQPRPRQKLTNAGNRDFFSHVTS